ncbi:chloramphenicol phosphotransferase CPT [Umezawaea sp. Da 62-37]|uniref:chloramphenicol phosphotransferase CPT n=1 Tax=Umezawaea sp. Da 62-37 TaxID=3075927 RepID=UPI0028F6E1FC|nr:chloramphenicol phosphotransferase CPT [Umezawaea sp. Da 62-37]WNV85870.1 chloramphenicol phosphotransferase CPT [Umezawaea sp. Da 62-37]
MTTQVIVLNGGSSSGKSGIARCLQAVLPDPWIRLGVDDLVDRLPPSLVDSAGGVEFGGRGEVVVGGGFRAIENAWMAGVAAMAKAGARVVVDDVFLGGAASQARTRAHLEGLDVLWVGVHCAPEVAAAREVARGDRVVGMAASQAALVHEGVEYDVVVDTGRAEALDCARAIAAHVL